MGEESGRGSGRVRLLVGNRGSGLVSVSPGRVGSGRVQEKWPVDNFYSIYLSIYYELSTTSVVSATSVFAFKTFST